MCASWIIQPGQRLATGPERNSAYEEVTSHAKPEERGWSAATQVKVSSPEIVNIAQGQGFHCLEASIAARAIGECAAACRGLSPWQVIERRMSELGRPALLLK